jgi:hypothetical protein
MVNKINHEFEKNVHIYYKSDGNFNKIKKKNNINNKNSICIGSFQTYCPGYCNAIIIYDLVPEFEGMLKNINGYLNSRFSRKYFGLKENGWANFVYSIANQTTIDMIDFYHLKPSLIKTSYCKVDKIFRKQSSDKVKRLLKKLNINFDYILVIGNFHIL